MKKFFLIILAIYFSCNNSYILAQAANTNYITYETRLDNIDKTIGVDVAFFVPVADSNNFAGTNFRTALLQNPAFGDTPIVALVSPLKDSVDIGALVVKTLTVTVAADLTKAQIRTEIDNLYNAETTNFINTFYARNDFWGLERIIP